MSLSRILNDEPAPIMHPSPSSGMGHTPVIDSALADMKPLYAFSHLVSPSRHSRQDFRQPPQPHGAAYQRDNYQDAGVYDYAGSFVPAEVLGERHYYPESVLSGPLTPQESREGFIAALQREPENESGSRKRKKVKEDGDYRPPTTRRSARRQAARNKVLRAPSLASEFTEPEMKIEEQIRSLEDGPSLVSSDLEDCREVWIGELGEYVLETQKRRNEVERWYEASVKERNSLTAQNLSRHYIERIARIPPPPPTPLTPSPTIEADLLSTLHAPSPTESNNYDYGFDDLQSFDQPFDAGAEDAAREFEESVLGHPSGRRPKMGEFSKRQARDGAASDESSDLEIPALRRERTGHPSKKRKLEKGAVDIVDELERTISGDAAPGMLGLKGKSRARPGLKREISEDSTSIAGAKAPRRRAPRKKLDALLPYGFDSAIPGSGPGSISGDVTPAFSRQPSPVPVYRTIYDLDEHIPELRRAKKVDEASMQKRIKALEDAQRKVWTNIARKEVAKVYKYHAMGYQARQAQLERIARLASLQARRPFTRTAKANKDTQAKAKRLMKEMMVFWKKNEKEERDVRKREHKEAIDRAKVEEEKRENARQARKLEFLISQTELYSHFVGNKLKTAEVQGDDESQATPAGADLGDVDPSTLKEINFDDEDQTNLHRHAKRNAEEAIALARQQAQQFDTQAALERKTNEAIQLAKAQAYIRDNAGEGPSNKPEGSLVDLDSDELNFQNPSSLSEQLTIGQPQMLMATLKEYQLKGLSWLATLYEQGINGILADEMGLGKTIQSISLLAYLAETHDIWGPFLVVAPATTLHNWQQEITRFVPKIKALPYWGNVKDRATLRKFWSKKEISYNQDAPFHVLITSYQLVTQDQQYFQRVKWQYMILDEAQNIKNSSSVRWKTLLGFHCRNRLLLTGTPIQNSMQELWALLHFIMPSLFDSHDEFNEWFSKDIENAAENKGSKLNEHQLRRLHMILKPFMLRRIKRHVQNELSDKVEKDIFIDLSARQRALYKGLLTNVSVADLLEKAANIGDADSARSLMNLVMQFRKVCNHPELFERADVVAPFSFCHFGRSGPTLREGDLVSLAYSTRNPIEYHVPELLYLDGGLVDVPHECSTFPQQTGCLKKLLNIWATDWIHESLHDEASSSFSFLRLLDMSPKEAHAIHISPLIRRRLAAVKDEAWRKDEAPYYLDPFFCAHAAISRARLTFASPLTHLDVAEDLPKLTSISSQAWTESCLSRPVLKWFVPPAVAPIVSLHCTDRTFVERQSQLSDSPLESLVLYGLPLHLRENMDACRSFEDNFSGLKAGGLFANSPLSQLPPSKMQVPEAKRLIYDSAKLARLDSLLQELKAGDHRVLVYFQMTRMMDIMEEYLVYRQYKYLRLDGSSKIEDRRDMVIEWQTRPDIFVFLLSTRAGGLGINLTAADTVVFYDHDWNPSNDSQAMDRAHRLGQTRQVTVYRLITRGTIDERIIQLARVKKDVQDIVVGQKNFTEVTKPSEIVQLLLNDEQLASLEASNNLSNKKGKKGKRAAAGGEQVQDLWNEEGDNFFGDSAGGDAGEEGVEEQPSGPKGKGKGRKTIAGTSTRARKPGTKARKKPTNLTPGSNPP